VHSPWPSSVGDLEFRTPTPAGVAQVVTFRNLPEANRFMIRTSVDPDRLRSEVEALASSMTDFSCVVGRGEEVVVIGFLDIVDGVGQPGRPPGTEGVIGYALLADEWRV